MHSVVHPDHRGTGKRGNPFFQSYETMDRRAFLAIPAASPSPLKTKRTERNLTTGINPYGGPWTYNEVVHLLKRTLFGSTLADIEHFKSMSMSQAVDELLNPTSPLPMPPLKDYTGADTTAAGATWMNEETTDSSTNNYRRNSFKKWWMGVMLNQDRSLREKLTLFWHNHFSTETSTIDNATFVYKHHDLLRQNALGNFKALVRAVTIDPAMLVYLNGEKNTMVAPDENYARELQELFTLGKENSPNYTEDDVRTVARVLTGWRNNAATIQSYFDETVHDTNNKTFSSSFYNGAVITGRTGPTGGDQELDDLINLIFSKSEEVSRFIVKKIYRWFVYYDIDSSTMANVIEPLALIFRNSNWDIKAVMSALLKSEHFFDALNQGCLIKSPIDLTVGLCREFKVAFPATYKEQYALWDTLRSGAAQILQDIGDPPDVSGWKAYYQEPQFHEMWINSDTYPKRNQFTDIISVLGFTRSGQRIIIDPIGFAKDLSNPADPNALITDSLLILYRIPLSQASRDQIKKDILLTGQNTDYYWTNAWNAYIASPSDMMAYSTVNSRLQGLYKYFMNLAEYHLA